MDEIQTTALIAAGSALAGVLITTLATLVVEFVRRSWGKEDRQRDRRIQVLDRRVNQIEQYLEGVTQDFRLVMNDAEFYLATDDIPEANRRMAQRRELKDSIDTRIFARGPAIRALADPELDTLWESLMGSFDKLAAIYMEIFDTKFNNMMPIDQNLFGTALNETWLEYSRTIGILYHQLDQIRQHAAY